MCEQTEADGNIQQTQSRRFLGFPPRSSSFWMFMNPSYRYFSLQHPVRDDAPGCFLCLFLSLGAARFGISSGANFSIQLT